MNAPIFLYGVGAAKAGTTWLARVFRAHPELALPPVKEAHYFDALENPGSLWPVDQLVRARMISRDDLDEATDPAERRRLTRRVRMLDRWMGLLASQEQNDARYESLMQGLWRGQARVAADITPAYALLSVETLKRMAALNEGRTRFLMVLRDPIDRLWSNIRMTLARRAAMGQDEDALRNSLMGSVMGGEQREELARSDYAGALERLERAVPEEHRMVVFYEDLFQQETLDRISAFLGLSAPLSPLQDNFNTGARVDLRDDEQSALRKVLMPQYECVLSRFGSLPTRWQDNMIGSVQ